MEKSLLFALLPESGLLVAPGEVADKDDGKDEGAPLDGVLEGPEVRLGRLGCNLIDVLDGLNLHLNPHLNYFPIRRLPKRVLNPCLNSSLKFRNVY